MFMQTPTLQKAKSTYKPQFYNYNFGGPQVLTPQQVFQQKINLLENKVSDFLLGYLKTFYNSNIHAEEDLTRTELQMQVSQNNGTLDIKPKLFIIPQHQQMEMYNLRLLSNFQLFIIKENKDNIFHYLKFLKGKADRKQCKSIKDTLYHINDFFISFTNKVKKYVLGQNQTPQFDYQYFILQQFKGSQNFTNIQVLLITRILMKMFLMKFIKDVKESKRNTNQTLAEENLIALLEFYKVIKDDLQEIETILNNSSQEQWYINPEMFKINKNLEQQLTSYIKKQINKNQQKTNFYEKLFTPHLQSKFLSMQGLTEILKEIRNKYAGSLKCEDSLNKALKPKIIKYKSNRSIFSTPKKYSSPNYISQNSYTNITSPDNIYKTNFFTYDTQESEEEEIDIFEYSEKRKIHSFSFETDNSFHSEPEYIEEEEEHCENGGTFFDSFYFDLLNKEIANQI